MQIRSTAVLAGLAAIGIVFLVFTAPGRVGELGSVVRQAMSDGDVLRPPVPFSTGWSVILGWLMGAVGFAAAWVALAFKRPSLGLLLPLPVGAIAAISIPDSQQLGSGLIALVLVAGFVTNRDTGGEQFLDLGVVETGEREVIPRV